MWVSDDDLGELQWPYDWHCIMTAPSTSSWKLDALLEEATATTTAMTAAMPELV